MRRSSKSVRRTGTKTVSVILCAVFLFAAATALAGCEKKEESRAISLIELDGAVSIERAGETLDAKRDMALQSGDVIAPAENGSARIKIDGDKFLYLDASSRVQLTAEGTAEAGSTMVYVEKGAVMTEVKRKLGAESSFDVVTPNTSMAIHGTKTLTEVFEDVLGAIKTSAAIVEGQVKFSTIQKNHTGKPVIVTTSLTVGQGFGVATESKYLLSEDDVKHIADDGKTVNGETAEETAHEELGSVLETPEFSDEFLTNIVAVLARSRDEDIEEGFTAEGVTEEELNAAINVLNDIIDGKAELPASVEEYIVSQAQPYYSEPIVVDTPEDESDGKGGSAAAGEPEDGGDTLVIDGTGESLVNIPDNNDDDDDDDNDDGYQAPVHVHNLVFHQGKAPSCLDEGWADYETCSSCEYTTYKKLPALGHDREHHAAKAATCTKAGWYAYDTCKRCSYTTYRRITALGHDKVHHAARAATCTTAGWKAYDTCTRCNYSTIKNLPALGHDFGNWSVETEPYPVYEGEFLTGWHAGTRVKKCSRCPEKKEEAILVTPVLKNELLGTIETLPIDFFSDFGRNPVSAEMTLEEFGTDCFWASSPEVEGDPFATVDLPGAVVEWTSGSTTISSLKEGDKVNVKITVPTDLKDVYENTVVSITLTGVHEHVWGEEGYIDEEHPLGRCCEICGEIMEVFHHMD